MLGMFNHDCIIEIYAWWEIDRNNLDFAKYWDILLTLGVGAYKDWEEG